MKNSLAKLRSITIACVFAGSASALTIIPTFDSSIAADANAVAITYAINFAIGTLQSNLVDNVTVKVTFVADENVGLGQSSTVGFDFDYSDFLPALRSHATSINDTNALNRLPNSPTDPVIGGTKIHVTSAQARVLGLDTDYTGTDSTVACKMSSMNFTRPPADPDKYDLTTVLEHEVDEVLGISSGLPATNIVWPADLFRYTTNLVRTFTTNGADNAYFSVDGTNLVARYNMTPQADYADWWSSFGTNRWAPPGVTPHNQVQDAAGGPGSFVDLGVSELTALDIVGWTPATVPATPPALNIVRSGANQFTLSWTNAASGYVLQERTNLVSGAWTFSTTGATNPAVLVSATSQKFYRLYKPAVLGQLPAQKVSVVSAAHGPLTVTIRSIQPRNP
jgi:hypothetical protein